MPASDPAHCLSTTQARHLAVRLPPHSDLRIALLDLARSQKLGAAVIVGAVGSLTQARLRFAGAAAGTELPGPWEILSLSGTFGQEGVHAHLALADRQGQCRGGHLMEGCVVNTTLELVVTELSGLEFSRRHDPRTGYRELEIRTAASPGVDQSQS